MSGTLPQIARAMGAYEVIVLGTGRAGRLALATELGASAVIDATREDPVQRVRELTAGRGADVAVECAGSSEAIRTALQLVRRGGRVGLTGLTGRKEVGLVTDRLVLDELDVFGVRSAPNLYVGHWGRCCVHCVPIVPTTRSNRSGRRCRG